ncbi:hypothetical protein IBT54_004978 [Pantoea sp. S62]|nr:hypothetical protein [Pantoea sp. S62]
MSLVLKSLIRSAVQMASPTPSLLSLLLVLGTLSLWFFRIASGFRLSSQKGLTLYPW